VVWGGVGGGGRLGIIVRGGGGGGGGGRGENGDSCTVRVIWLGEHKDTHRILVRKPDGRRPLDRLMGRGKDNIKINVNETG